MPIRKIRAVLRRHEDAKKAKFLQGYFKTGPGEYSEGDIFLGITVPVLRDIAKEFQDVELGTALELLRSAIHEERLLALLILILKYRKSDLAGKREIFSLYLKNTSHINNWDLVDVSAKHIVGDYLCDRDKGVLYKLARSGSLWDRRIAVISTFHFIANDRFEDSIKIAEMLISDTHDLIHKAVGWMLREVGKRDMKTEEKFLKKHYRNMPRTMLRYAIEKFPETKRQSYLNPAT